MRSPVRFPCVEQIVDVVGSLEELAEEVVFVGGASVGFLITDPAVQSIRPTLDVDIILKVLTRHDYDTFVAKLWRKGFSEDIESGVICRFRKENLILDVMPTSPEILGFANPWYPAAVEAPQVFTIDDTSCRVISPSLFLATKIEAFHSRGEGDYMLSHDLEDVVTVIDGCLELEEDFQKADKDVQCYLASQFTALLNTRDFVDAVPGFFQGDAASQQRVPILLGRIESLCAFAESYMTE